MGKWIPTILIAIAVASFFFFINPEYEKVKVLQAKEEANVEMLNKAQELESRREMLREQFNSISAEDREQLDKLLPDSYDNVRLILEINNVAETYGIRLNEVDVENPEDLIQTSLSEEFVDETAGNGMIGTISISLSVSTTYALFNQFLGDLENKLKIVDIKKVEVNTEAEEEGVASNVYDFNITLDTYWLR